MRRSLATLALALVTLSGALASGDSLADAGSPKSRRLAANATADEPGVGPLEPAPTIKIFQDWIFEYLTGKRSLLREREPFVVHSRQREIEITDCRSLVAVLARSEDLVDEAVGRREHIGYYGCVVMGLMDRSTTAQVSHFSPVNPLQDVADRLDLLSFRSSLRPGFDRGASVTWRELARSRNSRERDYQYRPASMSLNTENWYYEFRLAAAADWTGDGLEDLMVTFVDDSHVGTYLYVDTLVLEAPTPDGPLIAHEGAQLLRSLLLAERVPVPELKPKL